MKKITKKTNLKRTVAHQSFVNIMKLKIPLTGQLFIVSAVGIIVSIIIIYFLNLDFSVQASFPDPILSGSQKSQDSIDRKPAKDAQGIILRQELNLLVPLPVSDEGSLVRSMFSIRLKIPKIKIDAAVEYVGMTPEGAMDVPKFPEDVAWFELGPRPGEIGSAVIAGHFGRWKSGEGSVFDDLNQLKPGDRLSFEDGKGSVTGFVVRELRTLGKNDEASSVFDSGDGKAHLNLITCEGVYNKASKSYPERLVVFTDRE